MSDENLDVVAAVAAPDIFIGRERKDREVRVERERGIAGSAQSGGTDVQWTVRNARIESDGHAVGRSLSRPLLEKRSLVRCTYRLIQRGLK